MKKYVDTKELLANVKCNAPYIYHVLAPILFITPPAHVVEVVRCKDCAKWESYENTSGAGYCHNKKFCFKYGETMGREFTPITMPDDYCSYGERKEQ